MGNPAGTQRVAADVHCLPVKGCNVYFVGSADEWVLIDTGWAKCADAIRQAAESLFGRGARPAAILLTHGHPDHFGSAADLVRLWEAPLYAHPDDLPYLEGGVLPEHLLDPVGRMLGVIERVLPASTVDRMRTSPVRGLARSLPGPDSGVPGLPAWRYIHVPGHSPGHVVFFRPSDQVMIAGDVVLTAPLWGLLRRVQRLSSPPRMVSWDWGLTKTAVRTIAQLRPRVIASGHGVPMAGDDLADRLTDFAKRFSR